jgi:hypothetical protein
MDQYVLQRVVNSRQVFAADKASVTHGQPVHSIYCTSTTTEYGVLPKWIVQLLSTEYCQSGKECVWKQEGSPFI